MTNDMTDIEFMLFALKGDVAAVALVQDFVLVAHIWDDLVDRDKPVTEDQVNRAFTTALVSIPNNKFYQQHCLDLLPVIATGILNWRIANTYQEQVDHEAHVLAHVLRYGIADVVIFMAALLGGLEWAAQVGPELRRRAQKDTLANYLSEMSIIRREG